jgi:hypothetical protein
VEKLDRFADGVSDAGANWMRSLHVLSANSITSQLSERTGPA